MTVQNAPYIEVDTNNSTPLGVLQSASQNYVNSIDKLGSIFGSMKSNFQDRWYSDALKQSMQYDNADDYGKALSDGSIDLSGLSAEQVLSLNRRKKEIAETQLANLQAKEEDIKYRQQAADDKFFTEHPEAAATVARLREQALSTGDFRALNQYISDLGQSGASHRVLKEFNAESYDVRKTLLNLDLKRMQATAAIRQADAQIKLTNMSILDKKSDQIAAIAASQFNQAGINQSTTDGGTVMDETLKALCGGDPELYALAKNKIAASYGFDIDSANIANLKTAGTGLSDSPQLTAAVAGRTQSTNKGLDASDPIDNHVITSLDQNSDGTYKMDSAVFAKNSGVMYNDILTKYKKYSSEVDNLALESGNPDAINEEKKREAAKHLVANVSVDAYARMMKEEFPSMPDAEAQRLAVHCTKIYNNTIDPRIKKNPLLLVRSARDHVESDWLPGNYTSASLGDGTHLKVNYTNALGMDTLEETASSYGKQADEAHKKFDNLSAARANLEVAITSLGGKLTNFNPNSRKDANNSHGRADIDSDFIKANDYIKILSNGLKGKLPDKEKKNAELTNLKNAKVN